MLNTIEVNEPWITNLEKKYVLDALENMGGSNKWVYNETLRQEFAKYHNRKYGILTPNGTSAIHLILKALNIQRNDEVIIGNMNWCASIAPACYLGATPIFCDINKNWCIDTNKVEQLITPHTKCIIAVNLYGNMCNYDKLNKMCKKYNLFLIEDAAQSLGSTYKQKKSGSFGTASIFSLHRTKTLCAGEMGILLLDDDSLYQRCEILKDHGKDPNRLYWNIEIGYKYMVSNIQGALAYAQFQRIDELLKWKRDQFALYQKYLDIPNIQWNAKTTPNDTHGYWMTAIVFGKQWKIKNYEMIAELEKRNIPSRPFFYPLTSLPAFNKNPNAYTQKFNHSMYPVSYDIFGRGVNLPTSPYMTEEEIKYICDSVKEILSKK